MKKKEKTEKTELNVITEKDVVTAQKTLEAYKKGKRLLEQRIVENDKWWKMRHWEQIRDKERKYDPVSAWLFNSIANKHADVMDNMPSPVILPRENSDSDTARLLSDILPVILDQNDFEETYSDVWYDKLKGGTGVYGVFWDNDKSNGLGDVSITRCDILNLFWEPGVNDLQKSKNVFYAELFDNSELVEKYPFLEGKLGSKSFEIATYDTTDSVENTQKTPVIDWYYKKKVNGKTVVHFCKFCSGNVLYASENDSNYATRGFYDHGLYPFVFDRLFTEQGSPCGFGYIDIMKDSQTQIDVVSSSVAEHIRMSSRVRYFVRGDGSINEREFADWNIPLVHYMGSGDPTSNIVPVTVQPLPSACLPFVQSKIDELKETSGNRDFSQGGVASGVTAASAIAALQEAGSKLSRDMIRGSYRAFVKINQLVIELIRQFYTTPRCFRITLPNSSNDFVSFSNERIIPQSMGSEYGIDLGERLPVFDIKIKAEKENSYSKLVQNELAKEFFKLGFFLPQNAVQALACIDMMNFDGKDKVMQAISENYRNTQFSPT